MERRARGRRYRVGVQPFQEHPMRPIVIAFTVALLTGCGVETASTAATAGAVKKQEAEQGKKTMEQASRRVEDAMAKAQQRSQESDGGGK
jgi:uncharacterized protein YceK